KKKPGFYGKVEVGYNFGGKKDDKKKKDDAPPLEYTPNAAYFAQGQSKSEGANFMDDLLMFLPGQVSSPSILPPKQDYVASPSSQGQATPFKPQKLDDYVGTTGLNRPPMHGHSHSASFSAQAAATATAAYQATGSYDPSKMSPRPPRPHKS